jgi:hypothetical protein
MDLALGLCGTMILEEIRGWKVYLEEIGYIEGREVPSPIWQVLPLGWVVSSTMNQHFTKQAIFIWPSLIAVFSSENSLLKLEAFVVLWSLGISMKWWSG